MSRKSRRGYYVHGEFVGEGSALDLELKRELKGGDAPSKTEMKAQSAELQALGESLLTLRADLLEPLALPTKLIDALQELKRISNFEGRRRQSQFVGKLMRQLDEASIEAVRAALDEQRKGPAKETLALHAAERWRERLIEDDAAVAAWVSQFPHTDVQQLRALVRQARKDAPAPDEARVAEAKGQAPRQGRAFRELFQMLREQLADAEAHPPEVQPIDAEDAGYTDDSRAG